MNKKKILCSLLSLLLAGALLAGCDASAEGVDSEAGGFPQGEISGGPDGGMPDGMPEDMAMPEGDNSANISTEPETLSENQTQITGKVVSIVGNEVELALGSYGGSESGRVGRQNSSGDSGDPATAPESAEKPEDLPDGAPGDTPQGEAPIAPEGGTAPGDAAEQSSSSAESGGRSSRSGSFEENGVTQTLLIPVGLELSGSGGGQRSRDYSSISAGMILRVTLETLDDGSETIIAVRVLSN